MNKDFSQAAKDTILARADGQCEVHSWIIDQPELPKKFPKIDLDNPLHTQYDYHHANFKSSCVEWLHEDWNGVYIFHFYHSLINTDGKWGKVIADFCRSLAESRRPKRKPEEWQKRRMEDHGKKLRKPPKARKENPWKKPEEKKKIKKFWGVTAPLQKFKKDGGKKIRVQGPVSRFYNPKR